MYYYINIIANVAEANIELQLRNSARLKCFPQSTCSFMPIAQGCGGSVLQSDLSEINIVFLFPH